MVGNQSGTPPANFVVPGVDVIAATMDLNLGLTELTPCTSSITILGGGFESLVLYFTIERR